MRESASASAVKKKSSLKPKASMAPKKRVELLRQVTEDLPQANRNVLQFVIFHLDMYVVTILLGIGIGADGILDFLAAVRRT